MKAEQLIGKMAYRTKPVMYFNGRIDKSYMDNPQKIIRVDDNRIIVQHLTPGEEWKLPIEFNDNNWEEFKITMDKITALKLALDGKKVRHNGWDRKAYLYFDGIEFKLVYSNGNEERADGCMYYLDNWEEYKPEPKFKVGNIVFVKGKFGKVVAIDADGKYSISFDKDDYPNIKDIKEFELEPA